jgi:hypothetical protein
MSLLEPWGLGVVWRIWIRRMPRWWRGARKHGGPVVAAEEVVPELVLVCGSDQLAVAEVEHPYPQVTFTFLESKHRTHAPRYVTAHRLADIELLHEFLGDFIRKNT